MADADSGPRSPARFFRFRWAYVLLTLVLWAFFIPLIWWDPDHEAYWTPTFLLFNLLAEMGMEPAWMRLQGVFGLNLYDFNYRSWTPTSYLINPSSAASFFMTVLMVGSIAAFTIPERGKAKNLPATRGIHLRAKFATALVIGMALTALVAGSLDIGKVELRPLFNDLGWLPATHGWYYGAPTPTYFPDHGIAKPITWISALAGVFILGTLAWLLITFVRPGRDRYWHAERWTLIFTLFGMALSLLGLFGMRADPWLYSDLDIFLGGCYSTFMIGVFVLTWAWTCRTVLFMMMMRYEKAAVDSDEPVCFACGYDLRMLASETCPECGTPVRPAVLEKIREAVAVQAQSAAEA